MMREQILNSRWMAYDMYNESMSPPTSKTEGWPELELGIGTYPTQHIVIGAAFMIPVQLGWVTNQRPAAV